LPQGGALSLQDVDDFVVSQLARVAQLPGEGLDQRPVAEQDPLRRGLDDDGALAAADPRKADAATMKAREDAIARNALAGGEPVVVIVLGAAHDLTESVREADPNCGYIRLTTRKVAELTAER
jgi:hypothetical protein